MADVDLGHRRAAGEDERLRELLPADRAEHRRHDGAPVGVERAAEVGDVDLREPAQHAVDQARRQRAAPGVVPRRAPSARDVEAAVDGCDELRDVLRQVLEVAVHRHDDVAARPAQPRVHRGVLAEVPLEADRVNARVCRVEPLEHGERPVGRAVVDVDDLERAAEALERCDRAAVELLERAHFVVERDDDGELGGRLAGCRRHRSWERLGLCHRSRSVTVTAGRGVPRSHVRPAWLRRPSLACSRAAAPAPTSSSRRAAPSGSGRAAPG